MEEKENNLFFIIYGLHVEKWWEDNKKKECERERKRERLNSSQSCKGEANERLMESME